MKLDESLWEFPCQFPLKIMGPAEAPLRPAVETIVLRRAPEFDISSISVRMSRTGKHQSISIDVYVERKEQVLGLYTDLAKHKEDTGQISVVL
jgi:putative lipoic acid-binding regulatory protein